MTDGQKARLERLAKSVRAGDDSASLSESQKELLSEQIRTIADDEELGNLLAVLHVELAGATGVEIGNLRRELQSIAIASD